MLQLALALFVVEHQGASLVAGGGHHEGCPPVWTASDFGSCVSHSPDRDSPWMQRLPEWSSPRVEIDQNTDLSLLSNTQTNLKLSHS